MLRFLLSIMLLQIMLSSAFHLGGQSIKPLTTNNKHPDPLVALAVLVDRGVLHIYVDRTFKLKNAVRQKIIHQAS